MSHRAVLTKAEREFLPAALEVQESPPSPVGRAVGWTLVTVFTGLLVWSSVGTIEIVAVARGRVIPSGHSKVVQPLEAGVIRAIHVRDGREVRTGSLLLELDPTTSTAEHERLVREHATARLHVARLQALLSGAMTLVAPPGADPSSTALQESLLASQSAEQRGRLEAAALLVAQREAAVAAMRADLERLETTVPMLAERAEAYRKLLANGYVARMQYLEIEEQRVDRVQSLAMRREQLARDLAALAEARTQRVALEIEFRRARLAELTEWEARAASLAQEVVKARRRTRIQRLEAPIDGVVQQLAVHTVGGVVTPAQQLMVIVPRFHPLEVEVWVENKDAGFVKPGQAVEVKVDSFPFTRYGTIPGTLETVSRDAVLHEKSGLMYAARVTLGRSAIDAEGHSLALQPGMAVTAEIKIGDRRLVEFFLSPFVRSFREALRER